MLSRNARSLCAIGAEVYLRARLHRHVLRDEHRRLRARFRRQCALQERRQVLRRSEHLHVRLPRHRVCRYRLLHRCERMRGFNDGLRIRQVRQSARHLSVCLRVGLLRLQLQNGESLHGGMYLIPKNKFLFPIIDRRELINRK